MSYELPLIPPALAAPKAVKAAVEKLGDLTRRATEAHEHAYSLEQQLETFDSEEHQAAASALLEGKEPTRDPKERQRRVDAIAVAKRDGEDLDLANAKAQRSAVDVITDSIEEWQRALEPKLATSRARMLEAIAALDVGGREHAQTVATIAWVAQWPRLREFGSNASPVLRSTARYSANGDPMPWSALLAALRAAATPPEPPKPRPAPPTPAQLSGVEVAGAPRRAPVGDVA